MPRALMFGIVLLLCSGCERKPATEGLFLSIEANLKSLRQVPGRFQATPQSEESPFTAYFQQSNLQMVDEQPQDGSSLRRRYYFHEGGLFYYRELENNQLQRQFVIDKDGKVKNAIPGGFPGADLGRIEARAAALKDAAISRAGQMFVFPLMRNR
ncbi:MAG: hypothetical protein IANPNBLG_02839 [Bryobacteraceae bacterium]|nr:hypothetical protein [Bryobacteraceae bacterium]